MAPEGTPAPQVSPPPEHPGALPAETSSERTVSTFRDRWPQLVIVWLAWGRPELPAGREREAVWAAGGQRGQTARPTAGDAARAAGPGRGGWRRAIQFPFWNEWPSPTRQLSPPFLFSKRRLNQRRGLRWRKEPRGGEAAGRAGAELRGWDWGMGDSACPSGCTGPGPPAVPRAVTSMNAATSAGTVRRQGHSRGLSGRAGTEQRRPRPADLADSSEAETYVNAPRGHPRGREQTRPLCSQTTSHRSPKGQTAQCPWRGERRSQNGATGPRTGLRHRGRQCSQCHTRNREDTRRERPVAGGHVRASPRT